MNRYLIDYENAHWCGGQLNVVVYANSPEEAEEKAAFFMEEQQRELFSDEFNDPDEEDFSDECAYTVNSVELFDETSPEWEFFQDPSQAEFYPVIK